MPEVKKLTSSQIKCTNIQQNLVRILSCCLVDIFCVSLILQLVPGNYFANYFIMGGEKFDAPQPEAYLFGDNMDLNFLGNRPVPVRKILKNCIRIRYCNNI